MNNRPYTVIKFGGSLAASGRVKSWIKAIAEVAQPMILVPGGGPFADSVRQAQAQLGFSDSAAHRLALLAMTQYGLALCSLHPRFTPAALPNDFEKAWGSQQIPVWLPDHMLQGCGDIPESWDVTSDSLAAWLAGAMGAARLVLVKSIQPARSAISAEEASASRIVDPLFPNFLHQAGMDAIWLGPEDWHKLEPAISGREGAGAWISRTPATA